MIVLVILTLGALGGTTWLAMNQTVTGNPPLHRRLTATGIGLCLLLLVLAFAAAIVTPR